MQPDGRIVLAGEVEFGDDFALVRYEPDGKSLDASFAGGMVVTDFGSSEGIRGIAIQADGRIVAAGRSRSHGTRPTSRSPATRPTARSIRRSGARSATTS